MSKSLFEYMFTLMILSEYGAVLFMFKDLKLLSSTLREVVLVPNRQWGGDGLLGCVFGYDPSFQHFFVADGCFRYGLLHRIPPQSEAGRGLPESFDERDENEEQAYYVPADDNRVYEEEPAFQNDHKHQEWQRPSVEKRYLSTDVPSESTGSSSPSPSRAGTEIPSPIERKSSSPHLNGKSSPHLYASPPRLFFYLRLTADRIFTKYKWVEKCQQPLFIIHSWSNATTQHKQRQCCGR